VTDNLWNAFCATSARGPQRTAIVKGDQRLSFDEWRRHAERWASRLGAVGLRRHDRVLVWMRPSPDMAVAVLGIWAAGGIVVLMDPDERSLYFAHAVERVRPFAIVRGPDAALPETDGVLPTVIDFAEVDACEKTPAFAAPGGSALPTDPASIVFTSGSTGRPKGVTQSHGNLLRGCRAVGGYLGLTASDSLLCPGPWSFDYGFGQLLSTIVLGVNHVLPTANNPFGVCAAIEANRPTVFAGIPSLFTYLLRGVSPFRATDVSSIRVVSNTGGSIPAPILEELLDRFTHSRVCLNYGLTETYRTAYLDPVLVRDHPTSIGRGIPGVAVAIVREDGSIAAPEEEGEIVHRGDYICMGYWNDPEATARSIRPDPLAPSGVCVPTRALFTGDYGVIDERGLLYFRGRRDHQLKSMGVRVSPTEVEEILYRSTLVRETAVFGIKHDFLGDEVWAAIVPSGGLENVPSALRHYARRVMSPHMAPARYLVFDELPKTRTGKIDYVALKQRAAAEAPSFGAQA